MMRRPSTSSSHIPEADLSALKHGVDSDVCKKCFASSASSARVAEPSCSDSQRRRRGERFTSPSERSGFALSFIVFRLQYTLRWATGLGTLGAPTTEGEESMRFVAL